MSTYSQRQRQQAKPRPVIPRRSKPLPNIHPHLLHLEIPYPPGISTEEKEAFQSRILHSADVAYNDFVRAAVASP